jgi:hypothetical protein
MSHLSERQNHQLQQLEQMQPVVLLGMHRSGTSLTARILRDVGIHMGRWLSRDAESVFFQRLNRRVLGAVGAKWGYVDPLVEAMSCEEFVEQQTNTLRLALLQDRQFISRDVGIVRYFGRDLWRAVCRDHTIPWGWKDPRTTIVFPVWSRVFPRARWVHVLRNGVDVAISTHRRSKKQQRKLRNRFIRIDFSPITLDFGYCFRLWETYISFVMDHRHLVPPGNFYEMRFEDLLAEPQEELRRLMDFLKHPVQDDVLLVASEQINRSRLNNSAFAFSYSNEIPSLAASPLMQRLGYDYDLALMS